MVDAHDLNGVLQMGDGVNDAGFSLFLQETRVERGLCYTAFGGESAHLVIGEVAGMVAEGLTTGVAAHNGCTTDVEGIIETFL